MEPRAFCRRETDEYIGISLRTLEAHYYNNVVILG